MLCTVLKGRKTVKQFSPKRVQSNGLYVCKYFNFLSLEVRVGTYTYM